MEIKIGTVSAGTAPVQQNPTAPSSDSGFSEILSGVYAASFDVQSAPKQAGNAVVKTAVNATDAKQPGTAGKTADVKTADVTDSAQQAETFVQTDVVKETAVVQGGKTQDLQDAQSVQEGQEVTAQVEFGEIKVKLEGKLAELVWQVSEGKEEAKDEIIQALLDYLKKLQEKGGDDKAISLVMQLLAALRTVQQAPSIDLHVSVQNISAEVTAVSAEYSSTTTDQQEVSQEMSEEASVPFEGSDGEEFAPEQHPQDGKKPLLSTAQPETVIPQEAAVIPEDAAVTDIRQEPAAMPVQHETAVIEAVQSLQTTAQDVQTAQNVPEVQTQTAQTGQPADSQTQQPEKFPIGTAESMLDSILEEARKELGLEKAEFTQIRPLNTRTDSLPENKEQTVPNEPSQQEAQPMKNTEAAILEIRPNHRDGREELHNILGGRDTEKSDEPEKTEQPQQNAQSISPAESMTGRETAPVTKNEPPKAEQIPPERQLADELLTRAQSLENGRTEFTMVLNPESLGRITVRMASTNGRIEVSITAENDSTRQLLESRTEQLGSALRQNGVELERYQVVSGHENAQLMQDNYDGSSKNPYGRQDDGENEENEENGNEFLEILQQI